MIEDTIFQRVLIGAWCTECVWWLGVPITLFVSSWWPAEDRNLVFQAWRFLRTFSIRKLNSCTLDVSKVTGNPRYFPRNKVTFILKISHSRVLCVSLALGEINVNNLTILITSPNALRISRWIGTCFGMAGDGWVWKKLHHRQTGGDQLVGYLLKLEHTGIAYTLGLTVIDLKGLSCIRWKCRVREGHLVVCLPLA